MLTAESLLPDWLIESNVLSCRVFEIDGKPTHFGCLFRRHETSMPRRKWRIHHFPGTVRPSGLGAIGLSYALRGEASFTDHDGQAHALTAGDLFQVRQVRSPDQPPPLSPVAGFFETSVFFEPRLAEHLIQLGVLDDDFTTAPLPVTRTIVEAYVRLISAMEDHAVGSASALRKAMHLIDVAYEHARVGHTDRAFIGQACKLLSDHPEPSYTAESVAESLGMPYETFRRKFRKAVGLAPGAFQLRERISRSIKLLQDKSVQEVAAELGYANTSFFTRQFKAHVGLTPKHFKQQPLGAQPASPATRPAQDT